MPDCAARPLPPRSSIPRPSQQHPASAEEAALPGRVPRDPAAAAREWRLGLLCMLGVLVCWSGFLLSGRLSTRQAFTAGDMAALRFTGSLLAGLAVVAWRGWPRLSLVRGAALAFCAGFGYALPVGLLILLVPLLGGAVLAFDWEAYKSYYWFHTAIVLSVTAWAILLAMVIPQQRKMMGTIGALPAADLAF